MMQTEVFLMKCYYCEEVPTKEYYCLENGAAVCRHCLKELSLSDLLDLLEISTLDRFLVRYGIAIRRIPPQYPSPRSVSKRRCFT